jgi:hypothetical protein
MTKLELEAFLLHVVEKSGTLPVRRVGEVIAAREKPGTESGDLAAHLADALSPLVDWAQVDVTPPKWALDQAARTRGAR